MARRIAFKGLLAPTGIYRPEVLPAKGYRPTANSRFAVVKVEGGEVWWLIHAKSGASADSILPALRRKLTMTDKLAAAAAFESATHLDWAAFDALPAVTAETTEPPTLVLPNRDTVNEMRRLAAQAVT